MAGSNQMNDAAFLIENLGAKLFEKGDTKHLYFSTKTLCDLYGLKCRSYSSGRVSEATLNGEKISNSRAIRIITMFQFGKFHYDCNKKIFSSRTMPKNIVRKLKNAINQASKDEPYKETKRTDLHV